MMWPEAVAQLSPLEGAMQKTRAGPCQAIFCGLILLLSVSKSILCAGRFRICSTFTGSLSMGQNSFYVCITVRDLAA